MKKGGVELNLFGKADNKELAEVNIPKDGYNPYIQDGRNRGINIGEERQNEQKINTAEAEAKVRELQSKSVTDKSLEQLKLEIQRELVNKWDRTLSNYYVRG